jgi:tripartite-type tricarboxylate transporter receptor subunit TctC
MNKQLAFLALLFGCPLYAAPADAQGISSTPVRIIIPSPAAGPTDFAARIMATKLSEGLGQNVIIDNRPSVNGIVAAQLTSQAAPNGSTLMMGNSGTHAINAALYRKLPYDPQRDFVAVTLVVSSGLVLVAHTKLPANSFKDLVALARNAPSKLNIGVPGATGQLAGEALKAQTHIVLNNVPYKGSTPTEIAVLSGEVDVSLLTPIAVAAHVSAGKMTALAITSAKRNPLLSNVPTIAESGVEGYEFELWHGLFAPARTPEKIVRTLHRHVAAIVEIPQIRDRFIAQGFEVIASTPEYFSTVIAREIPKYRRIVADAGIALE